MKAFNYPLFALAQIIILSSCTSPKPPPPTPEVTKPEVNPGLVIGNPINYYDDKTLLFPVGCEYAPTSDILPAPEPKETKGTSVSGSFTFTVFDRASANGTVSNIGEYRNTNPEGFDMRNLLFMNKFTKQCYSLVDSGIHILAFEIHKEYTQPYVLYKVVKQDLNNDSLFTEKDIVSVYFSRPDGSNFMQLVPDGEDYGTYFYYPETNTILLKTFRDSNSDKQITSGDESNFFEVDLKKPGMGKNIFPEELRNKLKSYIQ